jgi:hypothetical protein
MPKKTVKGGSPKRQEFYYEKVARENARRFIDESSMSQRAVAKELGMNHYQELNNMLRGSTTILNQIPALARVLGKSECDFFKESSAHGDKLSAINKYGRLVSKVVDIMDSDDKGTKTALVQNIQMFHEKISERRKASKQIKSLGDKVADLTQEVRNLARQNDALQKSLGSDPLPVNSAMTEKGRT